MNAELPHAPQALQANEACYHALFTSIDEGIYLAEAIFDDEQQCIDLRYLDENPAAIRMVGQSAKGRLLSELGAYEQYWRDLFGHVAKTGEARRMEQYAGPTDTWYDFYVFKPPTAGENQVAVIFQDVTRRKRTEDALRLRGEQFETLLSQAPLGVYLVDANFQIRQVNPTAQAMFGELGRDLIGRDFNEFIHLRWEKHYASEIVRRFRHTLETGEPYHTLERASQRADRSVTEYFQWRIDRITLPEGGYGVVCYFQDVSQQVQARLAIAESEARYRTLFESIDEGFTVIELIFDASGQPSDYRFLEVNPAFEKHTGIQEALGKTVRELIPNHEAHWFEIYGNVALTGEPIRFVDFAQGLNGRWFDVYAFRFGGPESRKVAVLFTDITERRQAEAALLESEQQLRQLNASLETRIAQRTEELQTRKQQLQLLAHELVRTEQRERKKIAGVLHDEVQQLLVAVMYRLAECAEEEPAPQLAAHLESARKLIHETIQASRSLSVELSPRLLDDAGLPAALDWLARQFADRHALEVDLEIEARLPPLEESTKEFLFHAARELLLNVVKHAQVNQVQVRLVSSQPSLIALEVVDRGQGFDSQLAAQSTTSPTGFGLLSVRERAEAMGGHLQIQTTSGAGTRITLTLPNRAPEVVEPVEQIIHPREVAPSAESAVRILVVDDHQIVRQGLVTLLQRQDFIVVGEASNGLEALEQAETLHPDVVIMDVNMPHLGGVEATRRLKAMHPQINVIGLSLLREDEVAVALRQAGASLYLEKDAPAEQLFAAIRSVSAAGKIQVT